MPFQQLQMARLRALESERYVVSATNNGVSAVINHKGEVFVQAPQFTSHVLRSNVEPRSGVTPYSYFKNLPIILLLFFLVISARFYSPKIKL